MVSVKCLVYSSLNQEVGIRAHPMFLSVLVSIMSLRVLRLCMCVLFDCVMLMCCVFVSFRRLVDCR